MVRQLLAILLALVLAACSAQAKEPVRVASKIDTEGALIGAMILASLDARGIKTIDKLQLGPTNIVRRALLAGEIDLYPEYTGNGAFFYGLDRDPVWKSAAAGYQKIKALDAARGLAWLAPAPADNSWVIAVRHDVAAAHVLATMIDFADWINRGGAVKLVASAEFVESPAALPAFEQTYGFTLRASQLVILAGGDTTATMRAAAERTSGINAAMAYGTDGALAALDLTVMSDPKHAQIVYAPAPVIRRAVLEAYPEIPDALDPVFRSLDAPTLRRLNAQISVEGNEPAEVARDYLRSKGFLR